MLPRRTRIAFCAYTGKAASVLRSKLPGGNEVSTIHRLLYTPAVTVLCAASDQMLPREGGRCPAHRHGEHPCATRQQVSFSPKMDPLDGLDLVVADEASMIPGRLWEDLTRHGVPVLAVGDHGQLPPVQSSFNLMARPGPAAGGDPPAGRGLSPCWPSRAGPGSRGTSRPAGTGRTW